FLAETRSSPSVDAQLKDFVLGNFNVCALAAPGFRGLSKVGDSVTYQLTVQNTGGLPLFLRNVTDTLLGNIVVNGVPQAPVSPVTGINASGCLGGNNPLQPGASCTVQVTRTVQAGDPDPTPSTTTFVYNSKSDFTGAPVSVSAANTVNLFQPSATLTKTASPTVAPVGDGIPSNFQLTTPT